MGLRAHQLVFVFSPQLLGAAKHVVGILRVQAEDSIGYIDETTRAIFGRSYAAEPDILIKELKNDEAIAEADTLLLTVPNQLGVDYNAHVIESILKSVAPALGWR